MNKLALIEKNRIFSIIMSFLIVITMFPTNTFVSAASDIDGHWAEETLAKWRDLGWFTGDGNETYRPNDGITRAEFMALMNRMKDYTDESPEIANYSDVSQTAWYYKSVSAALAAGYITGTGDGKMSPENPITRQEAMTIVARVSGIDKESDTSVLTKASDGSNVAEWAKNTVAACINDGLIAGSNGLINPTANITRAESVVLLDRIQGDSRIFAFAGTYPASGSLSVNGDVTIAGSGVKLQNLTVGKDLTISEAVGEGDAYIENAIVKGDVYVRGGGRDSLYFTDFRVEGSLTVCKYVSQNIVRIVVSGESSFNAIILETGAIFVTEELASGVKISIEIPANYLAGSTFEFIGDLDNIINNGEGANIKISGTVNKLTLNESAKVSGAGSILVADVSEIAGKNTSFETKPASIIGAGRNDVTILSEVSGVSGGSGGGGSGGGGGGGGQTNYIVTSAEDIRISVPQGSEYTLPEQVPFNVNSGQSHNFAVTWTPNKADTSNLGVYIFVGELNRDMMEGYTNPNNVKVKLILTVTPVLESISITPPAKLLYLVDEDLDLSGMVITGAFSDGSLVSLPDADYTVTGYDMSERGSQTVTITVDDKTDTFEITVFAAVTSGALVSFVNPADVTVANGAVKTSAGLNLPPRVAIVINDGSKDITTLAEVSWDISDISYDMETKTEQIFDVTGTVTLPNGVSNAAGISLNAVKISITVSAARYNVAFDLSGQGGFVPTQNLIHGNKVTEPAPAPTSLSHDFEGWYKDSSCTDAWDFEDLVTEDMTLYAKWAIKIYTISFVQKIPESPLATLPSPVEVEHGAAAVKPADPVLAGHVFAGWFSDEACTNAYNWNEPVTGDLTLYAKFADALMMAADALTFEIIRGSAANNPNEQSITANLTLLTSLADHPGVTISWSSSNTSVISNSGVVTRPASGATNAAVILTATLTLSGASTSKSFNLVVLRQGAPTVEISGRDIRFAPGYPNVIIDEEGVVTVKVKLNDGVATSAKPVVVYYAMDRYNAGNDWIFDKESVLYGHVIDKNDAKHIAEASGPMDEVVITNNEEYEFDSKDLIMEGGGSMAVGIVLLDNDNLDDLLAAGATVIQLDAEHSEYPPGALAAVFNKEGNKIYAYFDARIINTALNTSDFHITNAGSVSITSVTVGQNPSTSPYAPYPSWAIVSLSAPVAADIQGDIVLTYTKGSTNIITDTNSNQASEIVWGETEKSWLPIVSAAQSIESYINPAEGTLCVEFHPSIWSENLPGHSASVILRKNGGAPIPVTWEDGWYDYYVGAGSGDYFTFPKDTTGTGTYTVEIISGLTALADSPFGPITAQNVTRLPIIEGGITAEFYDYYNGIEIEFPEDTILDSTSYGCNFILMVDGKRVLVREVSWYGEHSSTVVLDDRRAAIVKNGSNVTISYDPNAGGHTPDMWGWMGDASGAFVNKFGPITVSK